MESIEISAAGHAPKLGTFFDLETGDVIQSEGIDELQFDWCQPCSTDQDPSLEVSYFVHNVEEWIDPILGLNECWRKCTEKKSQGLWFHGLLDYMCPPGKVCIIVRIQLLHRKESLNTESIRTRRQSFIEQFSSMKEKPVGLVKEITYGSDVVIVLQSEATEDNHQLILDELLLAAKWFFSQLQVPEHRNTFLQQCPDILKEVTCLYFNEHSSDVPERPFVECVQENLFPLFDGGNERWTAQGILFEPLTKVCSQLLEDDFCKRKEFLEGYLISVKKRISYLEITMKSDPPFEKIPHVADSFLAFRRAFSFLEDMKAANLNKLKYCNKPSFFHEVWSYATSAVFDEWVASFQSTISFLKTVSAVFNLDIKPVESVAEMGKQKPLRVFHLQVRPDLVIAELQQCANYSRSTPSLCYDIGRSSKDHVTDIRNRLQSFADQAKQSPDAVFFISPSTELPSGTISEFNPKIIEDHNSHETVSSGPNAEEYHPPVQDPYRKELLKEPESALPNENEDAAVTHKAEDSDNHLANDNADAVTIIDRSQHEVDDSLPIEQVSPPARLPERSDKETQTDPATCLAEMRKMSEEVQPADESREADNSLDDQPVEVIDKKVTDAYNSIYGGNLGDRVAKDFVNIGILEKGGQPSIYSLQLNERISQSQPLRWFDIGEPHPSIPHKTILLMGATGSGKSTLVDAMVNYILGVKWDDPFRFKIVPKESSASQAHSQTTHISSYTIHHVQGMNIAYSITIIDTPGFGDTRGLQRDKQITDDIITFLTHAESRMDHLNAICLVVSSADARLTQCQKYILSSVMSLFGNDVVSNIRLLATFADAAIPPVVEACREAGFPFVLDQNGQPTSYNKFNNSVIFAGNQDSDAQQLAFNQVYWNMSISNFKIFFDMLGQLPAKGLERTKTVATKRRELERKLNRLEMQIKDYTDIIKEIENARQCKKDLVAKIRSTNSDDPYGTVLTAATKLCEKGKVAYNCNKCQVTCAPPVDKKDCPVYYSHCPNGAMQCDCSSEPHEYQGYMWIKKYRTTEQQRRIDNATLAQCENSIPKLKDELNIVRSKVLKLFQEISVLSNGLKGIALRSSALSVEEYVKLLQSRLDHDKCEGYRQKIQILDDLLKQWQQGGGESQQEEDSDYEQVSLSDQHSDTEGNNPKDKSKKKGLFGKFKKEVKDLGKNLMK